MKIVLTILSALTIVLATPYQAKAAGETGHSDLMRLLSAIYGLNIEVSDYLGTVNQSVDKVPLSAATQSGRASAKLHFPTVVTRSDLDEQDLEKLLKNNKKRPFLSVLKEFFVNSAMGAGVASLSNAESAEMLGKAMRNGDGLAFGMGLHYLLDVGAPFHDGYKGALNVPIPLINKLPFLHQIAFGHLADGTSPDRINVGKIVLAMEAMGPFLITLRESQKNAVGVNAEWLAKLTAEGVDVNDNSSIRNWFLSQDIVKKAFQDGLPSDMNERYIKTIVTELRENLVQLNFFNDREYLDIKLKEIISRAEQLKNSGDMNWSANLLIRELIDNAWRDGKLNERQIIKETVTDYIGVFEKTTRLESLIIASDLSTMPDYAQQAVAAQLASKNSNAPHTREWIIDQILEKVTRGMISQGWEKFNTGYTNQNAESMRIKIEAETIGKIEKHFFNRIGKYSYNPGAEYWSMVFDKWRSMRKEISRQSLLTKVITFCDIILDTKIYEGFEVHTLNGLTKAKIFFKTMAFIFREEFRNPLTTSGNFAVKVRAIREQMIEQIKSQFPGGLITEQMIEKSKAYNEFINAKYNSDKAVGVRQNTALAIKRGAEYIQSLTSKAAKGATLKCLNLMRSLN